VEPLVGSPDPVQGVGAIRWFGCEPV